MAVYVAKDPEGKDLSPAEKEAIEKHLGFARSLHIETKILDGKDVAKTLADFARAQHVTQIFTARACGDANRIIHQSRGMEVTVVAERRR
jgi:K+-sensing histidine kinase KdpD